MFNQYENNNIQTDLKFKIHGFWIPGKRPQVLVMGSKFNFCAYLVDFFTQIQCSGQSYDLGSAEPICLHPCLVTPQSQQIWDMLYGCYVAILLYWA